jgi:hypothetical protein
MQRAQIVAPNTSLQPPYSIIPRAIEKEILPFTAQDNIGVIVYSPMSAGLLTGAMTRERVANFAAEDWRRNLRNSQEPMLSRNLKRVERLCAIGNRHERTPGEVAIAWTLHHPAVTAAMVGFRSAQQLSGIIGAARSSGCFRVRCWKSRMGWRKTTTLGAQSGHHLYHLFCLCLDLDLDLCRPRSSVEVNTQRNCAIRRRMGKAVDNTRARGGS